jgi:exodeoxyribonuclease VII large subunit
MQGLDELDLRLQQCRRVRFERFADCLRECAARLARLSPAPRIAERQRQVKSVAARLCAQARRQIQGQRDRLAAGIRGLNAVSPLATLERGYAIVSATDGSVLRDAALTGPGEEIEARLAKGSLRAIVKHVDSGGK